MVSGSRIIWILTLGLVIFLIFKNFKNKANIIGFVLLFLGVIVFVLRLINMEYEMSDFLSGWDRDGIGKRTQLNLAALKMTKESPWFGVGLGNFLVKLPEFQKNNGVFWLQPVHNILLLGLSQVGILGLVILIFNFQFLISNKKLNFIFKIILLVIVISGMMDHYWLTLPQNVWLLVLVASLSSPKFIK
jgi:O-antigen ligase